MRITVPKKSALKPIEELPTFEPPAEDEPVVLQEMDTEANPISSPRLATETPAPEEEAPIVFQPADPIVSQIGEFPIEVSIPIVHKVKKRRRKMNTALVFGGAIGLMVLAGVGYLLYTVTFAERLSGELIAATAETLELSPVLIDKSRIKLSSDEVAELLKKLEHAPVPLKSNNMQVQLSGSAKGLEVSISAGSQTRFYRIDPRGNQSIRNYLSIHSVLLEDLRSNEIDREVTAFFVTYQNVLAKRASSDSITVFRDALALPSLVHGLGHQLVAAHGRGLYRCVYEDRDGGLYFLLPAGVKEFELIGRAGPDGHVMVPAEFHVVVQGEIPQPEKVEEKKDPKKPAKPMPVTDVKDDQMSDDQSDGKK